MKNPCDGCPNFKEDYTCAPNCKKRLRYVIITHEPWMQSKDTPLSSIVESDNFDELEELLGDAGACQ